jgi:hypothetical protein
MSGFSVSRLTTSKVSEWHSSDTKNDSSTTRGSESDEELLSKAIEPGLENVFDLNVHSEGIDNYLSQCGHVQENEFNDDVIDEMFINSIQESQVNDTNDIPAGLNAVEVFLEDYFGDMNLDECATSYYGINSIVRDGTSFPAAYAAEAHEVLLACESICKEFTHNDTQTTEED